MIGLAVLAAGLVWGAQVHAGIKGHRGVQHTRVGEASLNPGLYLSEGVVPQDNLSFSLNVHEFGYPALMERLRTSPVDRVFADLGGRMRVVHGRVVNLGESRDGLYSRPEHVDLKLYEHVGEEPNAILESALTEAHATEGAVAPFFVGVKMHSLSPGTS